MAAIEKNGSLSLPPETLEGKQAKATVEASLMSSVGVNEGSGLYSSTKDIDKTIRDIRDEWQ